jgi:[ribosomal protein S18]-alanine N-acetyltransferase
MISVNLQVRRAVAADHQQIADLMFFEAYVHRHLDWQTPLEWLGHSPYWVLEENGHIDAALACPPDSESIAWIRLFTHAAHLTAASAWSPLWEVVRGELAASGGATVAAIAMQRWFDPLLIDSGFALAQHIVLLEWNDQPRVHESLPADLPIRPMSIDDLTDVVAVDSAAFEPLWQISLPALGKAYSQAVYASVIENSSGMFGYQLSTWSPNGAHLARLAVRPEAQGRGLGAALINDLILHMQASGAARVTVNTQGDNTASLGLYHKLGFRRTGEQYPVYTARVE